jgi:hypothetical protein
MKNVFFLRPSAGIGEIDQLEESLQNLEIILKHQKEKPSTRGVVSSQFEANMFDKPPTKQRPLSHNSHSSVGKKIYVCEAFIGIFLHKEFAFL